MKTIITGATGMVGKSVLLECLSSKKVDSVLTINRNPVDIKHAKLKEIIHADFTNIEPLMDNLAGYDACFYCMGVSALGLTEFEYYRITYTMTEAFVKTLYQLNSGMVFIYVSGLGTDSSEKGRSMWARIKGKTENMVLGKGFKDAYAFRPGVILPERGVKSSTGWYNTLYFITRPFYPLLKKMDSVTTSSKVGKAMINSALVPQSKKILENRDINNLALL